MWVLFDFGPVTTVEECAHHPFWCAMTAALRVVQNEYPNSEVRCLGIAATPEAGFLDVVAEEMLVPTEERELVFLRGARMVVRIERGISQPKVLMEIHR